MKPQERRLGVAEIDGWHIEFITTTRFEATKDGETVQLDADTLPDIMALIELRDGIKIDQIADEYMMLKHENEGWEEGEHGES